MSKGTSGASRWSGWPWGRTPAEPGPSETARRTALCRAAKLFAALALLASCGRDSAQQEYDRLVASYRRGDLAPVVSAAGAAAARFPQRLWEFRLLQAEALTALARFKEAGALLGEDPPEPVSQARAWIDRAQLIVRDTAAATALLQKARPLAATPELAIRCDLVSGNVEASAGNAAKAEEFYRSALAEALRRNDLYYQANALNNLSVARRRQNHYEDSLDYGLRAVAAAETGGALRMAAAAHGSLGTSYAYLGQFEAALEHEQKSLEMNRRMGLRDAEANSTGELAVIYDRAGRHSEAIPQHEKAFHLAMDVGMPRESAQFADNLAASLLAAGQFDAAEQWVGRAYELATQSKAAATIPYLLRNRAEIAYERGRAAEGAEICRRLLRDYAAQPVIRWEAHHLLAEIEAAGRHYAAANREFEAALTNIEAIRSEVLDPRYKVTFLSRLIGFYRGYVDALVAQGNDARALAVAESSRARVLSERLGRDVGAAKIADPAALRAASAASGVTVLAFWTAPARSFAWLITPASVRRFDLPPAAEIQSLVAAYRAVVEHSIADPLVEPSGAALWDKVMAPIARAIPAGSRVVVVPDGPLHRLNLETLPVGGGTPHYWIEDVELAVAPSISFAVAKSAAGRPPGSLLVIGAPEYAGTGYGALPGAAAEVDELRKRFANSSPAVLTGKRASPGAYRAAGPEKYSLIHFAAHAEANTEKPLESAVVLSRAGDSFKLYASDVIDIPIHADLVTLSACRSAGAREYAGEGLMGFAWAFLHAGARAVVAGLWDVSDNVTAPLMDRFYEGVAAQRPPAAALRDAKLALLRQNRFRKPFYWGAFQAYLGGGAATAALAARR